MTNSDLLKGAIKSKGYTQEDVAKIIGISANTLSCKINNKRDFTSSEIDKLMKLLDITDMNSYFFVQNVAILDIYPHPQFAINYKFLRPVN